MLEIRRAHERGHTRIGGVDSRHTFSFGDYHDRRFMGLGPLRVINEDRVQPGAGFDPHPHRDMEIISYVLDGTLEHQDDAGNQTVIRPGDVQRISAGTGIEHSERNHSDAEIVHFLQIWIAPELGDLVPSYEERSFHADEKRGQLRLIGARDGREGAVTVHQDVDIYAAVLATGEGVTHRADRRRQWIQVARGTVHVNGTVLEPGDGLAASGETLLEITAAAPVELLLIDLPADR
jgi:quercetin 2,3-dioxygenase